MSSFFPNSGFRFLEALNHFEKAKTLVYRLPGVLTWPTSNVIIEESKPEKIKVSLFVLCSAHCSEDRQTTCVLDSRLLWMVVSLEQS